MSTFKIHKMMMPMLEKKVAPIQKRCEKYGNSFRFEVTGESTEYVTTGGIPFPATVCTVEVEGNAICNGWQFVASLEHTPSGNLIRNVSGYQVPERYYTGPAVCEHCGTNRQRKFTYIVRNTETGEFKQVGKTCLKDFTGGLDAAGVAALVEAMGLFVSLADATAERRTDGASEADAFPFFVPGTMDLRTVLCLAVEAVNALGYTKTDGNRPTAAVVQGWYQYLTDGRLNRTEKDQIRRELDRLEVNPARPETVKTVEAALEWIRSQTNCNNYLHNLQVVCGDGALAEKNLGIACSLIPTYNRAMARQEQKAQAETSNWQGTVGKRLNVKVASWKALASWETMYGVSTLYQFKDADGNIFIWKTGKELEGEAFTLTGTVKDHGEYKGTRQTELTRCKVA